KMEWLTCIRTALDHIENHLEDDITVRDIAERVYLSPYFFQRGFALLTGCGVAEYIRNRRLYRAALDLRDTDDRVIDIALRYRYETPESFAKAFSRFHGCTPSQARSGAPVNVFLPLKINISIQGGGQMDHTIAPMFPFKLIGFQRVFDYETAQEEIPKFWDEICEKYAYNVYAGNAPRNPYEKALVDNCIGEYGVCIDDLDGGRFRYLIAGKYTGGEVPEGMVVYEFPRCDWAVFNCIGPVPEALQSLNKRIFSEWLPGNPDYELFGSATVEWYDCINGEKTDPDYHSAVWVPVRKKHSAEAEAKWGDTEAYAEYKSRAAGKSSSARANAESGLDAVFGKFAECMNAGCPADSEAAHALVRELQSYITANFYTCTDAILAGLGVMYTADERFRANIDKHGAGTAEFASSAIRSCLG
ncbi:MAG: TipAS antibiotic-recognition domain-containing protein, partial [Clostridia bacterium]|nr:TipAS antibiotic-recognition domain-containing protein [Clostridia bacterium]